MRLLALIPLTLALVIAGCGGNSSQVSFTPSPSNPSPNPGGGDNGGGGNNPGNPGGGNNSGNPGGDNPTTPQDCGYEDLPTTIPTRLFGSVILPTDYDISIYSEATAAGDLSGTWVMVQNRSEDTISSEKREQILISEKSFFIIKQDGDDFRAINCSSGNFYTLDLSRDEFALPAVALMPSVMPKFTRLNGSNSHLIGIGNDDSTETIAIKISSSTNALGHSTLKIDDNTSNIDNVFCVSQQHQVLLTQSCEQPAAPLINIILLQTVGTSSDNNKPNRHTTLLTYVEGQLEQYGIATPSAAIAQHKSTPVVTFDDYLDLNIKLNDGYDCSLDKCDDEPHEIKDLNDLTKPPSYIPVETKTGELQIRVSIP